MEYLADAIESIKSQIICIYFSSDHCYERGPLLNRLLATCRLNGIDPEAYLRYILSILLGCPSNKVAELLPWNVVFTDN